MTKYRIGIDVGGTFTHAVAIDNATYQLAGQSKVPTTHKTKNGVAEGIIDSLNELLKNCSIDPQDVVFIAHSTTQATNALLEGDVANVGIIALGKGLEGKRVRSETDIGDIDLGNGKKIKVFYRFLDTSEIKAEKVNKAVDELISEGAEAIVAAEAFSVDDPANENLIIEAVLKKGLPAAGTHEISGLYGLRMRTRTAVINASIMPKMLEAANATEKCVKNSSITAPLMIMRSDGGVMSIDQMKKRPILTILSGPAAGVASALLYVKISDGIFLEVGGTSTDIAVIRNGKALVKSAEIGGHKVYLRTLDSRTVGIAGGSLPRMKDNKIVDVGPRSAHIAGLKYASFSDADEMAGSQNLVPLQDGYASIDSKYAITTTCAANILGMTKEGDWAHGNKRSAEIAMKTLSDDPITDTAETILKIACAKIINVINSLIKDYKLEKENIVLVGGGGGAAAIVPFTAKEMKMEYKIAENHAVISAIGAALAMVTDTIERSVIDPAKEDIIKIRNEAEESVRKMGAAPETIEVAIEIDQQKNILRAVATGTTELRRKDLLLKELSQDERQKIATQALRSDPVSTKIDGSTSWLDVWSTQILNKSLFGMIKTKMNSACVIDREGIIRIIKPNAAVYQTKTESGVKELEKILKAHVLYGDAGEKTPAILLLYQNRIIDMSGLINSSQITSLFELESKNFKAGEDIVFVVSLD